MATTNHSFSRYIIKSLLGPVLFVTLLLTGVIWLSQSLRFIEFIVNQGLPVGKFLYLTSLMLPSLLGFILPTSVFVAVLYTYNRLITESELVVMESAGLSYFQLAKPAIIFAAGVTLFGYFISLYLLPVTYREFKEMQNVIRNNYAAIFLQEGVFTSPIEGLTVYIGKIEQNGVLRNIFVHDSRNQATPISMLATEGRVTQSATGPRFTLMNGNRQEVDKVQDRLSMLYFDSYTMDLNFFNKAGSDREKDPQENFIGELLNPGDVNPQEAIRMIGEAHQRLTWPLLSFCLTMVASAFMLCGEFNRRGLLKRLALSSVAACSVIALSIIALNLTYKNNHFSFLIYLNILLASGIPLIFLMKNKLSPNKAKGAVR